MARPEKEAIVAEVRDRFRRAKSVILTDYRGLNVAEVTELRKRLREAGVEYKVVKNTLATLAARQAEIEGLEEHLSGPIAMAFAYEDPVTPAKLLATFAREHKNLELKAGVLEGRVIGEAEVKALAELPSREQLLAMVLGAFQAPLRGLVTVLSGPMRNLVYGLEALRKQRAGEAEA
ncbi:MAG: 50S ribosomal protein L10 [Firmicutes bacterium]|nr:50S ribosomal protein L10 [Bacillota bacterium]